MLLQALSLKQFRPSLREIYLRLAYSYCLNLSS